MTLVALLVGLAVLAVALLARRAFTPAQGTARLARRARALTEPAALGPTRSTIRRAGDTRLDRLAGRLLPRPRVIKARLEASTLKISLGRYGAFCLVSGLVATPLFVISGAPLLVCGLAGLIFSLIFPRLVVGFMAGRRRNRFLALYAEAIGLIVRGLRAGLPVTETIDVVGQEIADPVGQEFRAIAQDVRIGHSLETAMWKTAGRLKLPEFNFLVISLSVQRETGGNLAETLQNLEGILRRRRQMKLKIKAMSSEATASALIIGSLPFVIGALMWMVSRDYLTVLFTTPLGHLLVGAGAASLAIGVFVMRQMVRFEI